MKTLTRMAAMCAVCGVMLAAAAAATAAGVVLAVPDTSSLVNLPQGTLVQLQLADPVSTREAKPGDIVRMRVSHDVYLGTKLLIRKGETTQATITSAQGPRNWGRSGRIGFEMGTVRAVDGVEVALGAWSKEQDREESIGYAAGAAVGGAALLGPVGLVGGMFVKGRHVELPAGQEFKAAVRWDTAIAPSGAAPAAVVVPPVQPVVVVPAPAPVEPKKTEAAKPAPPSAPVKKEPEKAAPAKKTEDNKEPEKLAPVIPIIEDVTGKEPAKKK